MCSCVMYKLNGLMYGHIVSPNRACCIKKKIPDASYFVMMDSTLFVFLIVSQLTIDCIADTLCYQRETLEFGKIGQIRCSFQDEYFGLYWYDTQDLTQQPIIYREDDEIGGYGYESNRFDLTNDGSLIIINVTIEDERVFTVVILETPESQSLKHEKINVKVFARPHVPYPVIEVCEKRQFCYKKVESYHVMNCIVEDARPTVHLKWLLMTVQQEIDLTTQSQYSYHRGLNTTAISMELQTEGTSFRLFACKADNNTIGLDSLASVIIAEVLQMETNFVKTVNLNITAGSTASLACNGLDDMIFFVWKIISNDIGDDVIAYGYTTADLVHSRHPYNANSDGFLVIASFSETREGVYACFTSDGIHELSSSFHLTSIGPPLNQQSTIKLATQTVVEVNQEQRKLYIIAVPVVIVFIIVGIVVILLLRARRRKDDIEKDRRGVSAKKDAVKDSESIPLKAKNAND